MAITRDTQISQLNSNSSFYDWFVKENEEIIAKLNAMNTFTVEGGDGITAPIALTGKATISLSGKVDNGISFNGPVYFNNSVSIPNISVRVPSINSTVGGFTFGTPVRVFYDISTNTNKYEAARANDPDQAEVFGVVSEITSTHGYVTLLGQITGDFTAANKRGIGLTAGWIYFLDPGTTGAITDVEPSQTGQISKPVIMGITGNIGMVLQMRGNYLNSEGFSGGTGAFDRIIINIGTTTIPSTTIKKGTMVSLINVAGSARTGIVNAGYEIYGGGSGTDLPSDYALIASMTTRTISWTAGGINGTTDIYSENCLGLISDIFSIGSNFFVEITLHGYTDSMNSFNVGTYYLNPAYEAKTSPSFTVSQFTQGQESHLCFIKYSSNGSIVMNRAASSLVSSGATTRSTTYIASTGTTGGLNQGTNYLVNGNFEVWQRSNVGKNSAYTSTGNIVFADMWRRHDEITGSDATKNYSIIRSELDEYQTEIEGNPRYYVDITALGLSAIGASGTSGAYADYDHLMVGHVVPGAKKFDLNNLNVKFYGKVSASVYPVDVYLSRYTGLSLIDYKKLGTANLTTAWNAFVFNSEIPALENNGIDIDLNDDYSEIGIDFIPLMEQANINGITLGQNLTVSIASFVATIGSSIPTAIYDDYNNQLRYCQQFYYTNYDVDQAIGNPTMLDSTTPLQSVESIFIQPNKSCNKFKWPVKMRTSPTISIYSPYSGVLNDAYNKTAGLDLRNTSGTIGYNSQIRSAPLSSTTISGTPSQHGVDICVSNGQVNYDEINFNIVANSDFSI